MQRAPVVGEVVEASPFLGRPGCQGVVDSGGAGVEFLCDFLATGRRDGGIVGFEIQGINGVLLVGEFERGDRFLGVLLAPAAEVAEPFEFRGGFLVGDVAARVVGLEGRGRVADVLREFTGGEAGFEVAKFLVPVAGDDLLALVGDFERDFGAVRGGVDVVVEHALVRHTVAGDNEALFALGAFLGFAEADDFVNVAVCFEEEGEFAAGIHGAGDNGFLVLVLAPEQHAGGAPSVEVEMLFGVHGEFGGAGYVEWE